jgi:hypothetical protein
MSIISSAVAWAERTLQHIDGVFQPTIGTPLIRSNQDLMHLRTISWLLECQSDLTGQRCRDSQALARN